MGKNAAFGRPGASDRIRLWWDARSETFRMNTLLFLIVGALSMGLVWAAVSRDVARRPGFANPTRPRADVSISVPTPTNVIDLEGVTGTDAGPVPVADAGSTTTTAGTVAPSPTVAAVRPPATASFPRPSAATGPASPATTVRTTDVIYGEVPAAPPTSSISVPRTSTPTTVPPSTSAPSTSAPPTSPTSTRPPATSGSLLPPVPLPSPAPG